MQCGFCTPGSSSRPPSCSRATSHPSDDDIREALSGNLCRCTGYAKIFDAVRMAAAALMSDNGGSSSCELGRVGESVARVDGIPKVTGEFAYSSDLQAAGMLWGHTLRSPHAHARIVSIDISAALAMPGVHAVLTHDDVPGAKTYGLEFADQPVLADRPRALLRRARRARRRRAS